MKKKDIDWGNLGFGYVQTDYRFVSNFKDGKWDEGALIENYNKPYRTRCGNRDRESPSKRRLYNRVYESR